ncbi:MAG TPA: HAMP domain-containing sensor histidine kinase [Anaerovoracaceae bacterium]|nr:HAMP domain-containing sensor histidine kinase [Anaerovoracaceae bacterium]
MKKTVLRCARTEILASVLYAVIIVVTYYTGHSIIVWQRSPLYWLFKTLELYSTLLIPFIWFGMVLIIIYFYWSRTVGYIEDIAEASTALVQPDDADIKLPVELREIEDSMNQIKKTALKNEREAREAEQRKNDLVVNLAHDIRTPLSSVIGYLSLLDEAPDMPAEQRAKYTGITLEKAYRLERLIDEFFEITRFNLSAVVQNKGKINLSFMLRQMADEFYPALAPQGKQAVVHAPDDLVLWGDADKLSRVFNNILKNAIAYSYENSTIVITAFSRESHVVIQFINQGDPIPPQKLDTIFERFFRLDTARSSDTGGAGLGLAIAKEIVAAHGGTITAQSDGNGTTFTVILPAGEV